VVDLYYAPLYRIACCLARCDATASDLTQQTFFIGAKKGHQLRDPSKVKSWLFTTLHREFLNQQRRSRTHLHLHLETADGELPRIESDAIQRVAVGEVLEALSQLGDLHRAPLILFHLECHTYREIAEILSLPIGTVMSRISRGRQSLLQALADRPAERDVPSGQLRTIS
jgi:RNA polymerase sigma-70 factor (ECF subfamily)